ncbi:hypothetical protein [Dysgonomonas sp. ZJ709]|uniref:hypothetical protein n=1 Tax=Dysgonomonas sp. ZJ709 TaxID=2709797 RepID=UPI0013EC7BA4|nr:hypothetical protein [Dysgonomonas sp. ZJ709]
MNKTQNSIYEGLSKIRPDIAAFYKDGLEIRKGNMSTRSHIISHYLREIEGGLRDIMDSKKARSDTGKTSILRAFDMEEGSDLAENYLKLQGRFHALAHRDGSAIKGPRDNSEAERIWDEFEEILYQLVGSYNSLFDRIDTLIQVKEPTKIILDRIEIYSANPLLGNYLFTNLHQMGWLRPLCDETEVFNPNNNPEPIKGEKGYSMPIWSVLHYLKWVSENIDILPSERNKEKVWGILLKIIDDISTYRKNDECISNGSTNSFIYELIVKLPTQLLVKKHFNYIREFALTGIGGWINYNFQVLFLQQLLGKADKRNLLLFLETLFAYNIRCIPRMELFEDVAESYKEDVNLFDNIYTHLRESIGSIVDLCGFSGYKILYRNLLNRLNDTRNSYISFIGENKTSPIYNDSGISSIVYTTRDYLLLLPAGIHYNKIVKCLLDNQNKVIRRIGYYIVGERYDELKDFFWSLSYNPYNEGDASYELYRILKLNATKLNLGETNQLLVWLDMIEFKPEATTYDKALVKKQYLTSFTDIVNDKVAAFKIECDKDCPKEVKDTDFMPNSESTFSGVTLEYQDLSEKSLCEISDYYITNKNPENQIHPFRYFNYLTPLVKVDFKNNKNKYILNPYEMINADRDFQKDWLLVMNDCIRDQPSISITVELLKVIEQLLNDEFWLGYNNTDIDNDIYIHILEQILSFFESLLKNNSAGWNELIIIGSIINIVNSNKRLDETMVLDTANHNYIHSNEYLLTSVLIVYAYQVHRSKNVTSKDSGLDKSVKGILENKLSDNFPNPFFYFALTSHLNYLLYVESGWVKNNLEKIFNKKNKPNDVASIKGWLFVRPMDQEVFRYLSRNNTFDYVINEKAIFGREFVRLSVIKICSAYINNMLPLDVDDPLMDLVINSDDKDIFLDMIIYLSNEKSNPIPFQKIEVLWNKIILHYAGKPTEAYRNFVDNSFFLIEIYNPLSNTVIDIVEKMISIPGEHRFYKYIHHLLLHLKDMPERVAELITLLILNDNTYSSSKDMKEQVIWLYKNGFKTAATNICEAYAMKGNQELREIYKIYKK